MVERPIKKSERQIASPNDVVEEVLGTEPSAIEGSQGSNNPEERAQPAPRKRDKTKEKGKGNQQV